MNSTFNLMPRSFSACGTIFCFSTWSEAGTKSDQRSQCTEVPWLRWSDFVPASDQVLKQKIVPQAEKDLGIKLNVEFINRSEERRVRKESTTEESQKQGGI